MKLQTPVIVALLLMGGAACASRTTSVSVRKPDVEIVVPEGAKDTTTSGNAGLLTPHPQGSSNASPGQSKWGDAPTNLRSLFPGREIRTLTVVRYLPGWNAQTLELVRGKLFELTRRELEPPTRQIIWSEATTWTIEANIEFLRGPMVRILTDGNHTFLVDEGGKPWFFRISPAEYQCGFEMPGDTVRNDLRNPYCQARGLGVYLRDLPRR